MAVKIGTARTELWPIAIGLAKLEGDTEEIKSRFIQAYNSLKNFEQANVDRKLMAAEIMTASGIDNLYSLEEPLATLEKRLRDEYNVPEKIAIGVSATLLYGRNTSETYPVDRFAEFLKSTSSYESAAMLAISTEATDVLTQRFNAFKLVFVDVWGSNRTEDTDLAASYLACSGLDANEIKPRLAALADMLKSDLEYPLVPASILASMTSYDPKEAIDLTEKAVSYLQPYARGLTRSELISLAVRVVHGAKNEPNQTTDPTSSETLTPVQFTNKPMQPAYGTQGFYGGSYIGPRPVPYWYYWMIVMHNSHCSHYGNIGGTHPSHVHAVGGFFG